MAFACTTNTNGPSMVTDARDAQRKRDNLNSRTGLGTGEPMRRQQFVALIAGATITWALAAMAQEPGRMYRLGILATTQLSNPGSAARIGLEGAMFPQAIDTEPA